MRALGVITLAFWCAAVAGCCRPWFDSAAQPAVPPPQYDQGTYPNPYPSYSDPYASPSGQYERIPSANGYDPASPSNPYGPVTKPNRY